MAVPPFYATGPVAQVAINLFYGWGYNFYRKENQLRADDLMVRAKVSGMLGAARSGVEAAEAAYRRQFLPPPSRAAPRPDPDAMQTARALEAIGRELGALEGQIRALPVPENDRMTQRFRREAETTARLIEADQAMVGHAELLRTLLTQATASEMLGSIRVIRERMSAIRGAIQARGDLLVV
jgi:hypothetical protein